MAQGSSPLSSNRVLPTTPITPPARSPTDSPWRAACAALLGCAPARALNQPLILTRLIWTPCSAKPCCTTLHHFALLCSDFANLDHDHRPVRNLKRPCRVSRMLSAGPRELSKIFKVVQRNSKEFKPKMCPFLRHGFAPCAPNLSPSNSPDLPAPSRRRLHGRLRNKADKGRGMLLIPPAQCPSALTSIRS